MVLLKMWRVRARSRRVIQEDARDLAVLPVYTLVLWSAASFMCCRMNIAAA